MIKQYKRIVSLVCLACETYECEECNIEEIAKKIVNDVRADAIDECIEMLEGDCFVSGTASKVLIHNFEKLKENK